MHARHRPTGRFRTDVPKPTRQTSPDEIAAARSTIRGFVADPSVPERPDLDPEDVLGVLVFIVAEIACARRQPGAKSDPLAASDFTAHAIDQLLKAVPDVVLGVGWVESVPSGQDEPADAARRVVGAWMKFVDWTTRRFAPACAARLEVQSGRSLLSRRGYEKRSAALESTWKGRLSAFFLAMLLHAAPAFGPKGIEDLKRAVASAGCRSRTRVSLDEALDLVLDAEDLACLRPYERAVPPLLRVAKRSGLQHLNEMEIRDYVRKLARAGSIGRPAHHVPAERAGHAAAGDDELPKEALAAALHAAAVDDVDRLVLSALSEGSDCTATARAVVAAGLRPKFSDKAVAKRRDRLLGRAITTTSDPDVADALRRRCRPVA